MLLAAVLTLPAGEEYDVALDSGGVDATGMIVMLGNCLENALGGPA